MLNKVKKGGKLSEIPDEVWFRAIAKTLKGLKEYEEGCMKIRFVTCEICEKRKPEYLVDIGIPDYRGRKDIFFCHKCFSKFKKHNKVIPKITPTPRRKEKKEGD